MGPGSPRARLGSLCRGSGSPGSSTAWFLLPRITIPAGLHALPGAPPPRPEEPGMSRQLQRGGGLPTACPAHPGLRPSWTSSILRGERPCESQPCTLVHELPVGLDAQAQPF